MIPWQKINILTHKINVWIIFCQKSIWLADHHDHHNIPKNQSATTFQAVLSDSYILHVLKFAQYYTRIRVALGAQILVLREI
jgi:hypothetical protein